MASVLSSQQLNELKAKLEDRFSTLQKKIQQELRESDNQHYIDIAGRVHDPGEESLADLLVDIDLAITDLHIGEIRDTEQALIRFSQGTYGTCIDCGANISYERLQAHPIAKRCLDCQAKYEQTHTEKDHSSL